MTESLRERCIEAGATRLEQLDWDSESSLWYDVLSARHQRKKAIAEVLVKPAFDAVLDVLEESLEDWENEAIDKYGNVFSSTLLSVLRENGE